MRFENLEECLQFKKKIKPGMQLRIMGNVAPDRFLFDEMVISPQGIIAVPKKNVWITLKLNVSSCIVIQK